MIQYRPMQINDYDSVMALWLQTEEMLLREADSQTNIAHYLARNHNLSFVAENENHEIIGAILVGTDGRRGYIQHLSVALECRSQGIGRDLIAKAVKALKEIGIAKTHLFVNIANENAKKFYQRLGWQVREEVRMYSFNSSEDTQI
ncbi:GNAT family N-acetyltransferase [Celerinatantimonas diazotrophica]|uniref:Ribosomal protein S18 acetylase RimI-like enzyme n=1 Tax=Celerinatantimonas diazotrophica TaxID=412034 RepID=A0A4R1JNC6_9GAMM|nr:GNAT family N-acetyltransferase [Celerinatantimonas diazotrophica]TCK52019.1 ribosomal protein S18 acetylase RimI-like enzyme [Celerinatantimonas diazotrophica]CAG9296278.1 Acetyltransferase YpeA [Celerinatantimonas diazotrophica]